MFSTANYLEALLWAGIALVFAILAARRAGSIRLRHALTAVAFALFGLSDVVEVRTGAWWRPWWLLLWKAGCILVLVALAWHHYRRTAERD